MFSWWQGKPLKTSANSLPPFRKSDHATIFLLQEYKQRKVREAVVTRAVRCFTALWEATLLDVLSNTDWDMFQSSSDNTGEFADKWYHPHGDCTVIYEPETMGWWIHPRCFGPTCCCLRLRICCQRCERQGGIKLRCVFYCALTFREKCEYVINKSLTLECNFYKHS